MQKVQKVYNENLIEYVPRFSTRWKRQYLNGKYNGLDN